MLTHIYIYIYTIVYYILYKISISLFKLFPKASSTSLSFFFSAISFLWLLIASTALLHSRYTRVNIFF